MRFFQISLLLFIINSCSLSTTKGLIEQSVDVEYISNYYFSDEKTDYLYKAKIDVYNKIFGGLLIIKKIEENHHRIVFTTEIGNKLFDFEIIDDTFKVNYIIDNLNKNIVLNTLESDFKILVKQTNYVSKQFNSDVVKVYQSNDNYYFYKKKSNLLFKIISTNKKREKVIINFMNIKNEIASNIMLTHKNLKLKIDLTSIHK